MKNFTSLWRNGWLHYYTAAYGNIKEPNIFFFLLSHLEQQNTLSRGCLLVLLVVLILIASVCYPLKLTMFLIYLIFMEAQHLDVGPNTAGDERRYRMRNQANSAMFH